MTYIKNNLSEGAELSYAAQKIVALRMLVNNEVTARDIAEVYNSAGKTMADLIHDFLDASHLSPMCIAIVALKMHLDHRKRVILARGLLHLQRQTSQKAYRAVWQMAVDGCDSGQVHRCQQVLA